MLSLPPWLCQAIAVLSLSGIGCAPAVQPIALRDVARTVALGGDVQRIVVAADETRFLTVGELADLLWWDLGNRELLRRFEPFARDVGAVAVHPTEPWAVVAATPADAAQRAVFAVDLATGDVRKVLDLNVDHLAFSPDGASLGVLEMKLLGERRLGMFEQRALTFASKDLRGASAAEPRATTAWEPWSRKRADFPTPDGQAVAVPYGPRNGDFGQPCQSHRGTARGHGKWTRLQRFVPEPATFSLASQVDNWIDLTAITDTGTLLAADQQGQLFVQGLAVDDLTVRSGHRGEAHALTFSPDGTFVAVQGLGAVRFVGLDGREVGSCTARTWSGPAPMVRTSGSWAVTNSGSGTPRPTGWSANRSDGRSPRCRCCAPTSCQRAAVFEMGRSTARRTCGPSPRSSWSTGNLGQLLRATGSVLPSRCGALPTGSSSACPTRATSGSKLRS